MSGEPSFENFSGPVTMADPAGLDDLIRAMRELTLNEAPMTQLLQQVAEQQMDSLPPPAGGPVSKYGVVKIRPTLPIFGGSGDPDDHMEHFVSIADAEGWNDAQCKLYFVETLRKCALTWYMQSAAVIELRDWNNERALFLDFFRLPTYVSDRQVKAVSRKQEEPEAVQDCVTEKSHLWKHGDPAMTEFALVTQINLGLQKDLESRFRGARMSTLKEFLESKKAVEEILKVETDTEPPELEPDLTRDNGAAKERRR